PIEFVGHSDAASTINQRIAGTVTARASVETRSMETGSTWTALYLAARSATTVAAGKLQHSIPRIGANSSGDFSPFIEVKLYAGVVCRRVVRFYPGDLPGGVHPQFGLPVVPAMGPTLPSLIMMF